MIGEMQARAALVFSVSLALALIAASREPTRRTRVVSVAHGPATVVSVPACVCGEAQ